MDLMNKSGNSGRGQRSFQMITYPDIASSIILLLQAGARDMVSSQAAFVRLNERFENAVDIHSGMEVRLGMSKEPACKSFIWSDEHFSNVSSYLYSTGFGQDVGVISTLMNLIC
ncbi:unnamed protein product [Dovyalis caffra]|uniref:Uncharacterized protein n=1 Tax=Dovyalis caffra TaxID=77055 RepID=A0AAV1QM34_9ROSI|nr:unnamed protein product [Dovyalis caffra]